MAVLNAGVLAPDFTLPTVQGGQVSLRQALAKGPIVLVFFKVSCPVCQYAAPFLERVFQANRAANVTVLGISQDKARDTKDFMREYGVTFPVYFEFSQLAGVSPQQYLAIEPAVRKDCLLVNGEAVSLIPENAPKILEAVDQLIRKSRQQHHAPHPQTLRTRVEGLASRGRTIVNQLVALYNDCRSERDREFVLEVATELRMILMQPGLD